MTTVVVEEGDGDAENSRVMEASDVQLQVLFVGSAGGL